MGNCNAIYSVTFKLSAYIFVHLKIRKIAFDAFIITQRISLTNFEILNVAKLGKDFLSIWESLYVFFTMRYIY